MKNDIELMILYFTFSSCVYFFAHFLFLFLYLSQSSKYGEEVQGFYYAHVALPQEVGTFRVSLKLY